MTTENFEQEKNAATREQYLSDFLMWARADLLADVFPRPLPPVHVAVGHPPGTRKQLVKCHARKESEDGINHIYVSPKATTNIDVLILALQGQILAEQDGKLNKLSKRRMAMIGATDHKLFADERKELVETLEWYLEEFGPIPHAKLDDSKRKKQSTRMIKVECGACEFHFRTSQTQIDKLEDGALCPACSDGGLHVAS